MSKSTKVKATRRRKPKSTSKISPRYETLNIENVIGCDTEDLEKQTLQFLLPVFNYGNYHFGMALLIMANEIFTRVNERVGEVTEEFCNQVEHDLASYNFKYTDKIISQLKRNYIN